MRVRSVFGHLSDGRPVHAWSSAPRPGRCCTCSTSARPCTASRSPAADGVRRNVRARPRRRAGDYLASTDYIGGTIGRYANRIAGGRFDARRAPRCGSATHDRGNHLHGGPDGFDRQALGRASSTAPTPPTLRLRQPGRRPGLPRASCRAGPLRGRPRRRRGSRSPATTDATTVVNLTSHAYFNLDGDGRGHHRRPPAALPADEYTPVDATGIPLGDARAGGRARPSTSATPTRGRARGAHAHEQVRRRPGHRPQLRGPTAMGCGAVAVLRVAGDRDPDGGAHRPARPAGLHRQLPGRRPASTDGRRSTGRATASRWSRSCSRTHRTARSSPRRCCAPARPTGADGLALRAGHRGGLTRQCRRRRQRSR